MPWNRAFSMGSDTSTNCAGMAATCSCNTSEAMFAYSISGGGCAGCVGCVMLGSSACALSSQAVTFMVVNTLAPTTLYGANSAATLLTAGASRLQYQFCRAQELLSCTQAP